MRNPTSFSLLVVVLNGVSSILGVSDPLSDQLQKWDEHFHGMEFVGMSIFGTSHYTLDSAGQRDWKKLMPSGGHTVRFEIPNAGLGPDGADNHTETIPFTVSLFHQLKCLEIYHEEYVVDPPLPPSPRLRHCLNYLRQQILCRMNLRLESTKNEGAQSGRQYETVCRDWSLVYGAAEENYKQHEGMEDSNLGL
ncbi:hypothetical protein E1B28_002075 [Marasmius oreades]|uniref:Uncharacterized protein n=1 Tax=Marasmius oreades TaxID=181124 RepID=A0A9P7V4N5_9AGAR|nr:uncharacterized protein E1B28_002075 [Marasmius oreades]KAG7100300.1 hypothetical protein E1B28_002075 [Marasmius oreades]